MKPLVKGQRWISEPEPELGLGILLKIDKRTISIRFESSDCTRQYTLASAPLKRVIFKEGDEVELKDNTRMTIETVSDSGGLIFYADRERTVCEKDLSDTITFTMPLERLFAGITDSNKSFDLRYDLLESKALYDASPAKGFMGARLELIPHQFFIAAEVTSRYFPRVLLSDETGLGKTIEACLILHKLLITQRASRILIIVPESLVHQWFIELFRKFHLSFFLFDEAYCEAAEQDPAGINPFSQHQLEAAGPDPAGINPFSQHQLGIVSLDFLSKRKRQEQIKKAGWDMLVIDEAHHITDNENIYRFIQTLATNTFGLMLLTATPEQMGVKNHFRHLKLLDPERYTDFSTYLEETRQYQDTIQRLKSLIKKKEPFGHILDSYGPGRVIFRNKRQVIKGFPKRVAFLRPLKARPSQIELINREFLEENRNLTYSFMDDPRLLYLLELIKKKEKILVICRSKEKVGAIDKAIAAHMSLDTARFDETMSLLQRDRNAAWFSKPAGAQILICSEIGSEGRNFQFVHHLFLFDLPLNPELLEQRIGRVDRIGQKNDIRIHVPYARGSLYEIMARWYMDGLNLFEKNLNGSHLIFNRFKPDLKHLFDQTEKETKVPESLLDNLIQKSLIHCTTVKKRLDKGRNILLEMNSFKPGPAAEIVKRIVTTEKNNNLKDLLIRVLDQYGAETDFIDDTVFKLNFDHITDEQFPRDTGFSDVMTFCRKTAIARDDLDFFSWDHPFVHKAFEYIITRGHGSCTTALLKDWGSPGIWLETVFIPECVSPVHLKLERYLKSRPIRILVDHNGNDISKKIPRTTLVRKLLPDPGRWFADMEAIKKEVIPAMIETSRGIALVHSQEVIRQAAVTVKEILGKEITRLVELKKQNPGIREQEILLARTREKLLLDHLSSTTIRMDALRLIRVQ